MRKNYTKKIIQSNQKRRYVSNKLKEYQEFLYDDEDYDWHYIIRLLRYKLERTRKCILENNIIADAKNVGNEIQEVINLLKRIEKNKYFDELHKPFYEKYGRPKMILGKSTNAGGAPVTIKYSRETSENRNDLIKEYKRLAKQENQLRRKDLQRAFDLMLKNIWNWWD